MPKPFEIELDIGTVAPIGFMLDEQQIREDRDPRIAAEVGDDSGDPDDRTRLWRGAVAIVTRLLSREEPEFIRVFKDDDVWFVRREAIRSIRLHDPESPDRKSQGIGFVREPRAG